MWYCRSNRNSRRWTTYSYVKLPNYYTSILWWLPLGLLFNTKTPSLESNHHSRTVRIQISLSRIFWGKALLNIQNEVFQPLSSFRIRSTLWFEQTFIPSILDVGANRNMFLEDQLQTDGRLPMRTRSPPPKIGKNMIFFCVKSWFSHEPPNLKSWILPWKVFLGHGQAGVEKICSYNDF